MHVRYGHLDYPGLIWRYPLGFTEDNVTNDGETWIPARTTRQEHDEDVHSFRIVKVEEYHDYE